MSTEKSFNVTFTYTVTVEVEAISKEAALNKALATEYEFVDKNNTGAYMQLDEHTDPFVVALE